MTIRGSWDSGKVKYESILKGTDGADILTMTDAQKDVELSDTGEGREVPVSGTNRIFSPDANLQEYAQQAAYQALEQKQADSVSIILMRPGNGENPGDGKCTGIRSE